MSEEFKLRFRLPALQQTLDPIAVQVRGPDLKVLASGLTDQELSVPAGKYYVTARMPNGAQPVLAGPFEGAANHSSEVTLDLSAFTAVGVSDVVKTASVVDRWRQALKPTVPPLDAIPIPLSKEQPASKAVISIWRGRWEDLWAEGHQVKLSREQHLNMIDGASRRFGLRFEWHERPDAYIAVAMPGAVTATFFAVPFDGPIYEETQVDLSPATASGAASEEFNIEFAFKNRAVERLLKYVRGGLFEEASAYSGREVAMAEDLVHQKAASWLGAIIGCYVLIRLNKIAELGTYTQNLFNLAPHFPDVLALRVEYLARVGEHAAAAELLMHGLDKIPWARSGILYLLERARAYSRGGASLTVRQQGMMAMHAQTLERLAAHLDNNETIATYRNVPITWDQ